MNALPTMVDFQMQEDLQLERQKPPAWSSVAPAEHTHVTTFVTIGDEDEAAWPARATRDSSPPRICNKRIKRTKVVTLPVVGEPGPEVTRIRQRRPLGLAIWAETQKVNRTAFLSHSKTTTNHWTGDLLSRTQEWSSLAVIIDVERF